MTILSQPIRKHPGLAFTLIETMVAIVIFGIFVISGYAALSSWFSTTESARESLRATQILTEKMETVRLYNWNQLTVSNVPPYTNVFTEYYNYKDDSGFPYTVTILVERASIGASYDNSLCVVTATVNWTSTGPRSREMRTLVSQHGMQNTFISN